MSFPRMKDLNSCSEDELFLQNFSQNSDLLQEFCKVEPNNELSSYYVRPEDH